MKRYLTIVLLTLSSAWFTCIGAQERNVGACRTATWNLYAEGGATMVHGVEMSNVNAASGTNIFPEVGM